MDKKSGKSREAKIKYEEREYIFPDGRKEKYKVYYSSDLGRDKPAIEKEEAYRLADMAGITNYTVTFFKVYDDAMFYGKKQQEKFGASNPRGLRVVCGVKVSDKDYTREVEAIGSASPDNVDLLKNYLPEMAYKRAAVRAVLMWLGLHDLNADIEFPNNGYESLEEEVDLLSSLQKLVNEIGWTAKDLKQYLVGLGIKKNPATMTTNELRNLIDKIRSDVNGTVES